MAVLFHPEKHQYTSIDSNDQMVWNSVTSIVSKFKKPFNAPEVAEKVRKNKKSKWYGMTVEEILRIWKSESDRAMTMGTWYHNQRESDVLECDSISKDGCVLPIIQPIISDDGIKMAPEQKLSDGIYPEHFAYLKSAGICGQSDRVEVLRSRVNISDYKTNKKIDMDSYTTWDGVKDMMAPPISHLPDCNYWHYALQLSFYMYMILKHNPKLKPGVLRLEHVLFKQCGQNEYGNPIFERDSNGDPIIEDIVHYELPYLKKEVIDIIHYIKGNI